MRPVRRQSARRDSLRWLLSPGITLAAILLIEAFAWTSVKFWVPTSILLTAVVASSVAGSLVEGLIGAALTVWYYAYFLSTPETAFPYTHESLRRLLVYAFSAPAVALMVGLLKQRLTRIAQEAERRQRESAEAVAASLASSREAELAGRAAEVRFRSFVEGSVAGVFRTFEDGRMVACNQALVGLLGYRSREDCMAQNAGRLFAEPADREALMARLTRGEAVTALEVPLRRKDGATVWVLMNARRVDEGSSLVYEASVVDVTSRRQAEARLEAANAALEQRARDLAAAEREVDTFVHAVARDFRGPLGAIDGATQALLAEAGRDARLREQATRIAAGSRRMGTVLAALLELSEVMRSELKVEAVDLSAAAHAVAHGLRACNPEREVTFVIAEGLVAQGDGRMLQIALEHLLGSAWKATHRRERARIEFGATEQDGRRVYSVRDDGAAFDPGTGDPLWGALGRPGPAEEFEGMGIGLATVLRIIRRHGGHLWAEPGADGGAALRFTLGEPPAA